MSSILSTVLLRSDEMSLHSELREVIFGENLEMKMVWMQQSDLIASKKRGHAVRNKVWRDGWIRVALQAQRL